MRLLNEKGAVTVEYAIIAAVMVVVMAAIVGLARPGIVGGWVKRTKSAFFVSGSLNEPKSVWAEIQER